MGVCQERRLGLCKHCVLEKQTQVKFRMVIHCTKGLLNYIRTDVWGSSKTKSLGGNHYFVTFLDDFSRRTWVYLMKHKDEVFGGVYKVEEDGQKLDWQEEQGT